MVKYEPNEEEEQNSFSNKQSNGTILRRSHEETLIIKVLCQIRSPGNQNQSRRRLLEK